MTPNYGSAKPQKNNFATRHPLVTAIGGIIAISVALVLVAMLFLNLWTHHGATSTVPDVKGLSLDAATARLDEADLELVIGDSIFVDSIPGGTVVEIWPKPGAVVKAGREVYLTIVAFNPRMVVIEKPLTDISDQQAANYLFSLGFNENQIVRQYVPGENDNEVIGAKVNNQYVTLGSRIPANATVVLEVTRVPVDDPYAQIDSAVDSILNAEPITEPVPDPETL